MNTETLNVIRENLGTEIRKGLIKVRGYKISTLKANDNLELRHRRSYEEDKLQDILMLVLFSKDLVMATLLEDYARATGEETGEIAIGKLIETLTRGLPNAKEEGQVFTESYGRVLRRLMLEEKI